MENTDPAMKNSVLARIREQRISMRPKLYFALGTVFAILLALAVLLVSVALASFILFNLRIAGHESLLAFGPRGIATFLAIFPWPLLLLDALLVLALELLLRRFKFGYRSPVLYLLIALLAFALAGGVALDRGTDLNERILERADAGDLPTPLGDLYERVHEPAPHAQGVYRGIVTAVSTSSITITHDDFDRDEDDETYTIVLPDDIDASAFSPGDRIYAAGDHDADDEDTIRAFGVRELPE